MQDPEPVFAISSFKKSYGPASEWLREQIGRGDYEGIAKMSHVEDWELLESQDKDRSRLAEEVMRYINRIVIPLVLIKEIGPSITPEKVELFGKWLAAMMTGVHQDEISDMIDAAQKYAPDLVLSSDLQYFAGDDQPNEVHRTEEGSGPLLAAGLDLRLGDNATVSIFDDDQSHTHASIKAWINK